MAATVRVRQAMKSGSLSIDRCTWKTASVTKTTNTPTIPAVVPVAAERMKKMTAAVIAAAATLTSLAAWMGERPAATGIAIATE
jgi:hypothetical protein